MFWAKQKQVIDVNKVIEQTREGEEAKVKLAGVEAVLNRFIAEKSIEFNREKSKEGELIREWYYPFRVLEGELKEIANVINYVMPEDIQRAYCEDLNYAIAWNERIRAEKGE